MDIAKTLAAFVVSFGMAQFCCASVSVKDPIFDQAVNGVVELVDPNPFFGSFQSVSWRVDDDKSGVVESDSRSPALSSARFDAGTASEIDTWIMLMVAIGLIGYQLKRSQRSLFRVALPSAA